MERLEQLWNHGQPWIQTFDVIEELWLALLAFRDVYNTTWLIQRLGYQIPAQVRYQQLSANAVAA